MTTLAPDGVLRSFESASMWFEFVGSTATLVSLWAPLFLETSTFRDAAASSLAIVALLARSGTVVKRPCVPRAPAPAGAELRTRAMVATVRPQTARTRAAG